MSSPFDVITHSPIMQLANLDDVERQAVVEDLYPKYLEALEDME